VAGDPIIKLRGIDKSYGRGDTATRVLRDVSLEVERGEFVALMGESGSGKSTLLNVVGGLDKPDAGEVEVAGVRYASAGEKALARLRNLEIGFVFQAFNLIEHLSCLDNVCLPAAFSRARSPGEVRARGQEVLARVGLAELAGRKPGALSGGQKQRVAIARALFHRPAILLCDEPTGNLDTHTGGEVITFFRELNERDGVTLLIVTHEQRISSAAGRIVRIQDGRIESGQGELAPATEDAAS
jgi:putative ABC transport system ATP-binding protein